MLESLVQEFGGLAGVAALVAALVNAGKAFDIVKDGDAGKWSLGLNVLAFAAFAFGGIWEVNLGAFDGFASSIAAFIAAALTLLGQFTVSAVSHQGLKKAGVEAFGKSYS